MSSLHDPKTLPATIELDYFRRPRGLRRLKNRVSWFVFWTSLGLVAVSWLPGNRSVYQAGPVSLAHTMFNNECSACHTEPFQTLQRLLRADASLHAVSDTACRKCHNVSHHHSQAPAEKCAGCHREHRGRILLAQVTDRHCTACHADLKRKSGPDCRFEDVSSFANHPEFCVWRKKTEDPGTVQFNHSKHLQLPPEIRGRGIDEHLDRLKEQQCAFCHQTDPAGQYMLPIKYDSHCRNCHPLRVQVTGAWKKLGLAEAARSFARLPAPHPWPGQGPATVRAVLRERFLELAQTHPGMLQADAIIADARPLPGSRRPPPASKDQLDWAGQQLGEAERVLFDGADGCRRCHQETTQPPRRPNGLPDYGKPAIPERWLSHSNFKHDSHRVWGCQKCHAGAENSNQTKHVLLPKLATCRECHSPEGGARSDCFECHSFHAGGGHFRRQGLNLDCGEPWPNK